nr:MAG TPA_asm: hypothetical protein [Bacteriophage sp.]
MIATLGENNQFLDRLFSLSKSLYSAEYNPFSI